MAAIFSAAFTQQDMLELAWVAREITESLNNFLNASNAQLLICESRFATGIDPRSMVS